VVTDLVAVDPAELTALATRGAGILRDHGLVVAPAGSMYGLYASVVSAEATARVFTARHAPHSAPLPVIVHNPRQLPSFVEELSDSAERLIASYWPGPLTLVFRLRQNLDWHLGESAGYVALRMPPEPLGMMLASKAGPLACAAAAVAGAPPPLTAQMARDSLGDAVALYLDDGPRDGEASTIVDVSRGGAEVLREGAVPAHHVAQVAAGEVELGTRPVDAPADDADAGEPGDAPADDGVAPG
jgi:L-threonylcarbamoyladenylate synthase